MNNIENGIYTAHDEINTLKKRIDKIKDICNMEKFLKEYWKRVQKDINKIMDKIS